MLLCADAGRRVRGPGVRRARLPSCGTGRLRAWGWPGAGDPGAGWRAPSAAPPAGAVPVVRSDAYPALSWAAPRRADAVGVIARAAAASALHGTGSVRLGAELGVPAATVRGWLRRLRARAGQMLQEATAEFGRLVAVIETPEGRDPSPPGPAGSRLAQRAAPPRSPGTAAVPLTWTR